MVNSLFQWLMIVAATALHPFYVSVIDINHNAKDKILEVSVRIFTEDFEDILKKDFHTKVDLTSPADKAAVNKMINTYVLNKLQLKVDGKPVALHYIGYEIQRESTWSYFEVDNVPALKKMDINCNLLYDFEDKQMNIFHVKFNRQEKSYKLDNPKISASFEF